MVKRDELIKFVYQTIGEDLLKKALEKDEIANGVQFLGAQTVSKVALGVSCSEDFLLEAVKTQAQFCIFHHNFGSKRCLIFSKVNINNKNIIISPINPG